MSRINRLQNKRHKYHTLPRISTDLWNNIMFIWAIVSLVVPCVVLGFTEHLAAMAFATGVLLPLGGYTLLAGVSRKPWVAMILLFPWTFLSAFQIVLLYLFGKSIIAVDMFLNVVTTNVSEASELLANLLPAIICVVLFYLPPIITAAIACYRKTCLTRHFISSTRLVGIVLTLAGTICLVTAYIRVPHYRITNDLFPVNVCYNLKLAVDRTCETKRYETTSPDYSFGTVAERSDSIPELYIIVIGETSRADNWQLFGYQRPTTPELMNVAGLVAYPHTLSESNTTHKSVPMLLSPVDSHTFADSLSHIKSLITAFKEGGFATAAISNQQRNGSYIDFFLEEADTCVFLKDTNSETMDMELPQYIERVMTRGNTKQLIIVHTYGSHFKYNDRYPAEFAHFTPDYPLEATPGMRPKLINAYDNTIRYTSHMLNTIIGILDNHSGLSAMIYTSDHGEDIYDDDRHLFLHASPTPSYWQLHVPMLIWMSPDFREHYPDLYESAKSNADSQVSSSASLFPTVMSLAGLRAEAADTTRSLVSPSYTPAPHTYLTDRNESVSIAEFGITPP